MVIVDELQQRFDLNDAVVSRTTTTKIRALGRHNFIMGLAVLAVVQAEANGKRHALRVDGQSGVTLTAARHCFSD